MHRWWKKATTRTEWCIFEYSFWQTERSEGRKSLPTMYRPRRCSDLRRSAVHRSEVSSMNRSWRSISTTCDELNPIQNHNRCFSDRSCSTEFRWAREHVVGGKARFPDGDWPVLDFHPKSSVRKKKKCKRLLPQSGRERKGEKLEEARKAFTSSNTSHILRIPMLVRQL